MTRATADTARFITGLAGLAAASLAAFSLLWAIAAPLAFGWTPVAVTSGSMQPHIDTGDIVFVEPTDGDNLQPGAVIVFDDANGGNITHRIVDITPTGDYVTRGDANNRIDSTPVTADQIRGVGRMILPAIGHPIVWGANRRWLLLGLTVIAMAAGDSITADILQPPTGLTAIGGADVTLDWTITPDTYATGHTILRSSTPGGPYSPIATTTPRTTSTFVDAPPPGAHYYVVRAAATNWQSANSNEDAAKVDGAVLADSWQSGLTHTAGAGADRVLVFVATNEQQSLTAPTLTSVTYGGQPLTYVMSGEVGSGCCNVRSEIWVLREAGLGLAADATITPNWTSAPDTPLYSHAIFDRVDQASPVGDTASASVVGDTPNPVPMPPVATTFGDVVIAVANAGEAGSYTAQNGFTLGSTQSTTAGGTTAHGSAHKMSDGPNETVSMLFNPAAPPWTNRQVALALVLNVAP